MEVLPHEDRVVMVAILVAKEAANAGIPTFTFISAAANFPLVPSRYVTSKRSSILTVKLT
jgi:hypothetical protein